MAKSLRARKDAAKRKFDRLARKPNPSNEDLHMQIDVAVELAELNAKTMTVEEAEKWADWFIRERPSIERAKWAGEFVGRVKAHSENPRGPKPDMELRAPADIYDSYVQKARRLLRHQGFDLDTAELGELLKRVNHLCSSQLLPPIKARELRQILRRLKIQ
jgi:hypothetical protein